MAKALLRHLQLTADHLYLKGFACVRKDLPLLNLCTAPKSCFQPDDISIPLPGAFKVTGGNGGCATKSRIGPMDQLPVAEKAVAIGVILQLRAFFQDKAVVLIADIAPDAHRSRPFIQP